MTSKKERERIISVEKNTDQLTEFELIYAYKNNILSIYLNKKKLFS